MKAFLVIFAIYISYVLCEGSKVAVKSFPKKVKPYGNGKILINSAKYEFKAKQKYTTQSEKKTYTVFQLVGIPKAIQGVPDSPYFPVDQGYDHKPRVKKVLPDYPWSSIRSKRSAVLNASPVEQDDRKIETTVTENKPVSKLQTIIETTTMATTAEKLDNEEAVPKPVRKSTSTTDKDIEEKKEVKSIIQSRTDDETKTETTITGKKIERAGQTTTSTKRPKADSKTAKNNVTSRERKSESESAKNEQKGLKLVDAKTNKMPQPKSDGKGDGKSKNADTLKSHIRTLSESRAATAKGKSKGVESNTERPRRTKSKPKENSAEAIAVKLKSKGREAITDKTSTKVKSKDNGKDASATTVRKKTKGKDTKPAAANVRAKENVEETSVKNKKNDKITKVAARKKGKKRQGNTATKVAPLKNKNRSRPKKSQKTKSTNATRTWGKPKAQPQRRLIAAREALIEDYPYVVSIQKDGQHWCTGALLNPRLVITTANCLWKAKYISRMMVRSGSRHVNRGGQLTGIQEVMKHPGWKLRKGPDNDVALILLDKNVKFTDTAHGVDLPNRVMLPPFDDAWVTSWGSERRDGVYDVDSSSLQVYHTRLMDREKCNNITMRFSVIVSENFICLAQSGRTGPCTRDTGAPAVSDGILWGLASWGIRKLCGTERFPAMFSYLASHSNLDFITNATRFLMSDNRLYPFLDRFPNIRDSSDE